MTEVRGTGCLEFLKTFNEKIHFSLWKPEYVKIFVVGGCTFVLHWLALACLETCIKINLRKHLFRINRTNDLIDTKRHAHTCMYVCV